MKRDFTKHIKSLSQKELVVEINKLYNQLDAVKQYYKQTLTGDSSAILAKYKAQIKKEYMPTRGYGRARSGESKKVITAFKKIAVFPKDIIDLTLYRAEMMMAFTLAYGDIDESFYNSLASSFESACAMIVKEKILAKFQDRCQQLIKDAEELGWGVYDDLDETYKEYFSI